MPRRKFIDKKNATTFALVHRAQNDPLINDENAPSMVFAEKESRRPLNQDNYDEDAFPASSGASMVSDASYRSSSGKIKQRGDLEEEFGLSFKPNEGQAAQHGVFFDDTKYDYMQHMRDLGSGGGQVTWVEASAPQPKGGKGKQKLEDALRNMDIGGETQSVGQSSTAESQARSLLPEEVLPSEFVKKRTYQDQQDIPDAIAGFQPDMDPRLREALEALDDDAYVDDEDDFFGDLVQDSREVDPDEWERLGEQQMFEPAEGDLDDGWESDDTIKAGSPSPPAALPVLPEGEVAEPPVDVQAQPPADPTEGAWLDEFKKFKSAAKADKEAKSANPVRAAPSALESSALFSTATGRTKKRKGAKTSTTNYSMSSSALVRTDQQTLLDSRFDKIEEDYAAAEEMADDENSQLDDGMSAASGMTGMSKASRMSKYSNASGLSGVSGISSYSRMTDSEAPQLTRGDFDGIMDDFLGGHARQGKAGRRVKKAGFQTGMEQLDEIRSGLGPARFNKPRSSART